MRLLKNYITRNIVTSIAFVTLLLTGLQVFILFVNQLDDLGKGEFNIIQAALYVFSITPYQVYLFFPLASLLGALIGLSVLGNHRELIVMRASGMSIGQITHSVLKASFILIIIMTMLGELVIPRIVQWGNNQKMQAMSGGQTLRTAHGVWLRNENDFITIASVLPNNRLEQVYQFHFDKDHHLSVIRNMNHVDLINGKWFADQTLETIIKKNSTQARHLTQFQWDMTINPNILRVSANEPDEMSLFELHQFVHTEAQSHQSLVNYQLAFWQRLVQPLTSLVMAFLAIPFIFGPLRSSTMGSKLLVGATVGFGFHLMNRFFGPISQVFQWPPVIAALGPTILFAFLGFYLLKRAR